MNFGPPLLNQILNWINCCRNSNIELNLMALLSRHCSPYFSFAIESYETYSYFFWDSFPKLRLTFLDFSYCWRIRNCHHAPFDRQARAKLRIHIYIWMFLKYSNPGCFHMTKENQLDVKQQCSRTPWAGLKINPGEYISKTFWIQFKSN